MASLRHWTGQRRGRGVARHAGCHHVHRSRGERGRTRYHSSASSQDAFAVPADRRAPRDGHGPDGAARHSARHRSGHHAAAPYVLLRYHGIGRWGDDLPVAARGGAVAICGSRPSRPLCKRPRRGPLQGADLWFPDRGDRLYARPQGERLRGKRWPRDHPRGGQGHLRGDRARCLMLRLVRETGPMNATGRQRATSIVSARDIVNRFGSETVHDRISLDIASGEILGIAGGSGSGKSVLLKTLTGLHRPHRGEVIVAGRPIDAMGPAERASLFGLLFQQGALFSSLSVAQNVMLPMREHTDLPPEEQERLAAMKLELAGLPADTGLKSPAELSGGMVKRAAFARALALDPRILFLDEPTSDLDPLTAGGIDALIAQLNRSLGITVVVVTHDLTTLLTVCSRLAILVEKKITVGTVDTLMRSSQPWIHEFLHGP